MQKVKQRYTYQRLFHDTSDVSPFFAADIFAGYYRKLHCLLVGRGMSWTSYIPETVIQRTRRIGLRLYSQERAFQNYIRGFASYRQRAARFFERTLKKPRMTKSDVAMFFATAQEYSRWYSKMEFFYTDAVYNQSRRPDQQRLRRNVRALGPLKLTSRRFLNRMVYRGGYLSRLLNRLSREFRIPLPTLRLHKLSEIIELYQGRRVSRRIISARLSAFVLEGTGRGLRYYSGRAAEQRAARLLQQDRRPSLITGTVANSGNLTGRVRVIPPDYSSDIASLHRVIKQMSVGEILVAESTTPELMAACKKAAAIITNQGGLLSHAAIVSRELHIPCIVGTGDATRKLKNGDLVKVDATQGIVTKIRS